MAKTRLHCFRSCVTDNGTVCKDYKTALCPESMKHAAAKVAAYRKRNHLIDQEGAIPAKATSDQRI